MDEAGSIYFALYLQDEGDTKSLAEALGTVR